MDTLPAHLSRFLASYISSVEQLEVLLLLQGSPGRPWTPDDVAAEIRTATSSAAARLADLAERGLLQAAPSATSYRYAQPSDEQDRTVAELRRLYAERRVSVITAIYSAPASADPRRLAGALAARGEEE